MPTFLATLCRTLSYWVVRWFSWSQTPSPWFWWHSAAAGWSGTIWQRYPPVACTPLPAHPWYTPQLLCHHGNVHVAGISAVAKVGGIQCEQHQGDCLWHSCAADHSLWCKVTLSEEIGPGHLTRSPVLYPLSAEVSPSVGVAGWLRHYRNQRTLFSQHCLLCPSENAPYVADTG